MKQSTRPFVCVQISSRHRVIRADLIGVVQLIGPETSGLLLNHARRLDHVARQLRGHAAAVARHDGQLGAEDAHVIQLLARERVGADDVQRIALDARRPATATRRCCRRCIPRPSRPASSGRPSPPPRSWRAPSGPSCFRSDSRSPVSAGSRAPFAGAICRSGTRLVLPMHCRMS